MRDEIARRPLQEYLRVARASLDTELARHQARPFPSDIDKGDEYGSIDPVMDDAALFGWAATAAGGGVLTDEDRERLGRCGDDVLASLPVLPAEARAYFDALAAAGAHALVIDWLGKVGRRFLGLVGDEVLGWSGVEMALRDEGGTDRPQFEDPDVPFRQFHSLDVSLETWSRRITCVQSNDVFGLYVESSSGDPRSVENIYRFVDELRAPTGVVEAVEVVVEDDVIAEVTLTVAGAQLLLVAGEVEEGLQSELTFCRLDECVLLFLDTKAADRLPWMPPRSPLA